MASPIFTTHSACGLKPRHPDHRLLTLIAHTRMPAASVRVDVQRRRAADDDELSCRVQGL
jgi:hypothetical protein